MSNSTTVGGQRQKRVLPSRSRRGGPGIGNCDVDVMILDTQKRKAENEPLIPIDTPFLLTTNSSLVPSTSSSTSTLGELNTAANTRYFERAEVLKAYREQQIIQTPEFSLLSEQASVSSRFRPRGSEDETADTSDAAYEKRHRKYESFEKRQRLREKEKLKHEQYKLKERIEQLRAMDGAAFLALPSSSFSPAPAHLADDEADDASVVGLHGNDTAPQSEGERRRKEMLDVALVLLERYRTLLPPERKGFEKEKKSGGVSSISEAEVEPVGRDTPTTDDDDDDSDIDAEGPIAEQQEKIKLKIPARLSRSSPKTPKTDMTTKWQTTTTPKKLSRRSKLHALSLTPSTLPLFDSGQTSVTSSAVSPTVDSQQLPSLQLYTSASRPTTPLSRPNPTKVLADGLPHAESITSGIGHLRTRKRKEPTEEVMSFSRRATSRVSPPPYEHTTSLLLISAYRNADAPKARKTQRHVTAFGHKLPTDIEHWRDFELPAWLFVKDDVDEEGLEVESQLLAGSDMDTSGDQETSVVNVSTSSAPSLLPQKLEAGESRMMDQVPVGVP